MSGQVSQTLPVPPGYPEYLPKPTLRDGGLYLDPYPVFPKMSFSKIPAKDIAWVMVALQPYVLQYAERPYDVNWVIDGWGSGKMHIVAALNGMYAGALPLTGVAKQEDFLIHPKEPSGFDRFLISLNTQIGSLMGKLFDSIIPGTGTTIKKLIDRETWSPPAQPVDTSGVLQEIEASSGGDGGYGAQDGKPNYLLWAGIAAALVAVYVIYDSDS